MNYFEKELQKIVGSIDLLKNPVYVGRSCFGDIGGDLRARIEFTTLGHADHYSNLRVSIMNRTEGVIDHINLQLKDILGKKGVPDNPYFPRGVDPYIWVYNGSAEWYAFTPSEYDYAKLRDSITSYIEVFLPREDLEQPKEKEAGFEHGIPTGETVWVCVYKDALGHPDDFDNLTDICVPTAWLIKELKAEGQPLDGWFDEYTADNTDLIARKALELGIILDCADSTIKDSVLHKAFRSDDKQVEDLYRSVKAWYMAAFPFDDSGEKLHQGVSFNDVLCCLNNKQDVYAVLGPDTDSLIRERVFEKLSSILAVDYQEIYEKWVQCASLDVADASPHNAHSALREKIESASSRTVSAAPDAGAKGREPYERE